MQAQSQGLQDEPCIISYYSRETVEGEKERKEATDFKIIFKSSMSNGQTKPKKNQISGIVFLGSASVIL